MKDNRSHNFLNLTVTCSTPGPEPCHRILRWHSASRLTDMMLVTHVPGHARARAAGTRLAPAAAQLPRLQGIAPDATFVRAAIRLSLYAEICIGGAHESRMTTTQSMRDVTCASRVAGHVDESRVRNNGPSPTLRAQITRYLAGLVKNELARESSWAAQPGPARSGTRVRHGRHVIAEDRRRVGFGRNGIY